MSESQTLLTIPLRGKRAVFVTESTNHLGPIVYVGEGEPGMFPQPATLNGEQARQVRDVLTQWLVGLGVEPGNPLAAEVERLTGEGVAASERRDYYKARCEQMEADHAETVAEVDRVRELHSEFRIFEECGHRHTLDDLDADPPRVHNIPDVGIVCEDGHLYSICRECCTDGGQEYQTETCAGDHDPARACWPCNTHRALDGGEQP